MSEYGYPIMKAIEQDAAGDPPWWRKWVFLTIVLLVFGFAIIAVSN